MEFKYHDGQNRRTPSQMSHPLPTVAYVSKCPLQGSGIAPSGFPDNVPASSVFPMPVPVNAEEAFRRELVNEQIRRELEKEEIRREIIAGEMGLAWRRELEEEVRSEMASERVLGMPVQRQEEIWVPERLSMPFNQRINYRDYQSNNSNIFGGPQYQLPHSNTHTWRDQVTILARPDARRYDPKRKAMTPLELDGNNQCSSSLHEKTKLGWSCELCQITTTSEKGLNDHLQGKKHKAKEASLGTQKIGLDSRRDR